MCDRLSKTNITDINDIVFLKSPTGIESIDKITLDGLLVGRPTDMYQFRKLRTRVDRCLQQLLLPKVEQIIAISTLIKKFSLPMSKIIGEIPDTKCTVQGMDLRINK